jgi:hypothetical protein
MRKINIASTSDIHLGHRRTSASEIIVNLRKAFPDNSETADLDIIFLAGDVFDEVLNLSDDDVWEINAWVSSFLRLCKKHDILLRILEGTPSHDRGQSKIFPSINASAEIGANLKYVNAISIEYVQELDKTILYVPDEATPTTEETYSQVLALLKAKGLTQVDLAIMHGQFEYQLPAFVKAPRHNSEDYLKLVKYFIFIGHIHQHSVFDRIIAHGSFDRLGHGDESVKGHIRASIWENGEYEIKFVENKDAKKYVTINCEDLSIESTLKIIESRVKDLPNGSYVRIEANADNPVYSNMEVLITMFPLITWSKITIEVKDEERLVAEEEMLFEPILLTRENLGNLLLERIRKSLTNSVTIETAQRILNEVENEL